MKIGGSGLNNDPLLRPGQPSGRTEYRPGELAQWASGSEAHDILSGNLACLLDLGAVPRAGVYDNEHCLFQSETVWW